MISGVKFKMTTRGKFLSKIIYKNFLCPQKRCEPKLYRSFALSSYVSNSYGLENETHPDYCIQPERRTVPISKDEYDVLVNRSPEIVESPKLLQVAVLGLPNVGKSTLTNQILKWKVCTVSKKVHTTRRNCKAVLMEENTQVVFLDTPGIISPKEKERHHLEKSLLVDPEKALVESDVLLVVHDVSCKYTRRALDPKILKLLSRYPEKESALVLNKVDRVTDKLRILDLTDELTEGVVAGFACNKTTRVQWGKNDDKIDKEVLFRRMEEDDDKPQPIRQSESAVEQKIQDSMKRKHMTEEELNVIVKDKKGWPGFTSVFMVSALYDDGIDALRRYLISSARPSPWRFSGSLVTDQSPYDIVVQTIKEKLLDHLPMEVPYMLNPTIEFWDVSQSGLLTIVVAVRPKAKHWVKLIVGAGGAKIKQISSEAEQDLRNTFRFDVKLKISVEEPKERR